MFLRKGPNAANAIHNIAKATQNIFRLLSITSDFSVDGVFGVYSTQRINGGSHHYLLLWRERFEV